MSWIYGLNTSLSYDVHRNNWWRKWRKYGNLIESGSRSVVFFAVLCGFGGLSDDSLRACKKF